MTSAMAPTTVGRRRFECVINTSNKFWEIEVSGTAVTIRYGRIGTAGQSLRKTFPGTMLAQQHAAKLVQEKLAKGYVEIA